ncbi:MAG: transposase [Caedimonadaceae bacterium]|nr:MAG: transposase [Caedimonadaceae bacterium]
MPRIKHSMEQIIAKLRKAEILFAEGKSIDEVAKTIQVTKHTYYRWKKEYGGLQSEQARRLKDLEKENARLKKIVADLSLDNDVLKEINKGNF